VPLRLAVLGSGLERPIHTRGFPRSASFPEIIVFSPTETAASSSLVRSRRNLACQRELRPQPKTRVRGADIVLAAARSRGELPILFGEWLRPGALVARSAPRFQRNAKSTFPWSRNAT